MPPSSRFLPSAITSDNRSKAYMTGNWKDGMGDNTTTSIDN